MEITSAAGIEPQSLHSQTGSGAFEEIAVTQASGPGTGGTKTLQESQTDDPFVTHTSVAMPVARNHGGPAVPRLNAAQPEFQPRAQVNIPLPAVKGTQGRQSRFASQLQTQYGGAASSHGARLADRETKVSSGQLELPGRKPDAGNKHVSVTGSGSAPRDPICNPTFGHVKTPSMSLSGQIRDPSPYTGFVAGSNREQGIRARLSNVCVSGSSEAMRARLNQVINSHEQQASPSRSTLR